MSEQRETQTGLVLIRRTGKYEQPREGILDAASRSQRWAQQLASASTDGSTTAEVMACSRFRADALFRRTRRYRELSSTREPSRQRIRQFAQNACASTA